MPDFRRLGQPYYGFHRLHNHGGGQHPGFRWDRVLTFEAGALISDPTGFDEIGGLGSPQLSVNAAAAIRGNWGYQVDITNTNDRFGRIIVNQPQLEAQFLFDRSPLTMGINEVFNLVLTRSPGAGGLSSFLQMQYTVANGFRVRYGGANDAGASTLSDYIPVPAEACQIILQWKASDGPGMNNGFMRLFVNNELAPNSVENFDNDTHSITNFDIGAPLSIDAGTSGQLYYDNIMYSSSRFRR